MISNAGWKQEFKWCRPHSDHPWMGGGSTHRRSNGLLLLRVLEDCSASQRKCRKKNAHISSHLLWNISRAPLPLSHGSGSSWKSYTFPTKKSFTTGAYLVRFSFAIKCNFSCCFKRIMFIFLFYIEAGYTAYCNYWGMGVYTCCYIGNHYCGSIIIGKIILIDFHTLLYLLLIFSVWNRD